MRELIGLLVLTGCGGGESFASFAGLWARSGVDVTESDAYGQPLEACRAVEEELDLREDGSYERVRQLSPATFACDDVSEAVEVESGRWAVFEAEEEGPPWLAFELESYSYDADRDRDDVDLELTTQRIHVAALGERDGVRLLLVSGLGEYAEVE